MNKRQKLARAEKERKEAENAREQVDQKAAAKEKAKTKEESSNKPLTDDGVNFSNLKLSPECNTVTFLVENTTKVAKTGFVRISYMDFN